MEKPLVLVGVSGGIAAYKTCSLVRALIKENMDVRVLMTRSALDFVGAKTFEGLCGQPVITDEDYGDLVYPHLDLRHAKLMIIAPATAATISKIATGASSDIVSETALAFHDRLLICPSMNTDMLNAPPTKRNTKILEMDGVHIAKPGHGLLACGDVGDGRMAKVDEIIQMTRSLVFKV